MDFQTWDHETLAKLAHDLWVDNIRVRSDLDVVHDAWRGEVIRSAGMTPVLEIPAQAG